MGVSVSVIEYGLGVMNLKELDAYTEENNVISIKLLEKCKFIEIARVDDEGYYSDRIYHMIIYRKM